LKTQQIFVAARSPLSRDSRDDADWLGSTHFSLGARVPSSKRRYTSPSASAAIEHGRYHLICGIILAKRLNPGELGLRLTHAAKRLNPRQGRDFACGLLLGYASLTSAKRLNIQFSKIVTGTSPARPRAILSYIYRIASR